MLRADKNTGMDFFSGQGLAAPSALLEMMDGVFYFAKDRQGRFVHPNKLLQERFGLPDAEAVLGKTDFDFLNAAVAEKLQADDRRVMETGEPIKNKLELIEGRDGRMCWLFTSKTPLRNAAGEIVGLEGISTDAERAMKVFEPYQDFRDIMNFIHNNHDAEISVARLAELACMSITTFERRFRRHFSCTPKHYILQVRIREACRRLQEGENIKRVATDLGFCDQSHFTKTFKRWVGCAPGRFIASQRPA